MAWSPSKNPQVESLVSLRARVQNQPKDGSAWLALAQRLAQAQPGPELSLAIDHCIELLPDEHQAWLLAGLELQHRQGPEAARNWLKRISDQRPQLVAPRLALAQILPPAHADQARLELESLAKDFPKDSRAHVFLAELSQNQGRLTAAGDHLEQALQIKPDIAENWAALAMLRLTVGRLDDSVKAASRAIELNDNAGPRLTRAEAYRQAAQWDLALRDYRYVQASMPKNPFVLLGLGACLAGVGNFEESLGLFNEALQIKPDLVEAQLNIALVLASQAKAEESLSWLQRINRESRLPPTLDQSARTAQAILQENQRLLPALEAAEFTGELGEISQVLQHVPAQLDKADKSTRQRLEKMARACQEIAIDSPMNAYPQGAEYLPFLEACLQCKLSTDLSVLAGLWLDVVEDCVDPHLPPELNRLLRLHQAIEGRQEINKCQAKSARDEAQLRYWHYRLLQDLPEKLPGQFKVAANSLGLHQTTPPECLHNALKYLMAELRPSVPAGWNRGIFMHAAINQVHAFIDGNGRLARFFLNLEMESAGHPVVLLFPEMRREIAHCLDQAQYRQIFEPYRKSLIRARMQTGTHLEKFHQLVEQKKKERGT
jgi:tetratricopeptide (TPR) repeat protein